MSNLPCADIDHPPWPLQRATADIALNSMTPQINLALEGDPLLHFAGRQDVVFLAAQARLRPARPASDRTEGVPGPDAAPDDSRVAQT